MRKRKLARVVCALIVSFVLAGSLAPLSAADALYCEYELESLREWIEGGKKKDADELSDKDREKMRELEQLPRVQQAIEDSFVCLQEQHQQQAYRFNTGTGPNSMYDNPILQEYVNRLGQSLVPEDSSNLLTFRIIYDPRPDSFALSTGSIYVTTGMLSMLDNEAQLSHMSFLTRSHTLKGNTFTRRCKRRSSKRPITLSGSVRGRRKQAYSQPSARRLAA